VAGSHNLESSYFLAKHKTIETFPLLKQNNLKASMIYHDGQSNDAKLNVAIALTASAHGADVANYVTVDSLVKTDGKISGAIVHDSFTGESWEIKAKVSSPALCQTHWLPILTLLILIPFFSSNQGVINATGPFTDSIRKMDNAQVSEIVAPSAGTHIVIPGYFTFVS